MKTITFIICTILTFTTYGGKCRNIVNKILNKETIRVIVTANTIGKLMLMPQRKLALRSNIEVVGSWTSLENIGKQIAYNLEGFDHQMEILGFKKHTPTKIFISEKAHVLSIMGPVHFYVNIFNLWHRSKADDLILMQPSSFEPQIATSALALFHERVHSILDSMFNRDSYLKKNIAIQEGLADFLTAYYIEDPVLNFTKSFTRKINEVPSLPLNTLDDVHDIGKVFSYTLWKLQEHIGKEEMKLLLKPFIEGLGQYYESFKKDDRDELERIGIFLPEYEYFLAVLKKTLQKNNNINEDKFIDEIATHLKLNTIMINDIANSITKSNKNIYAPSNKSDLVFSTHSLGIMVIAFEIYLIYLGLSFLF